MYIIIVGGGKVGYYLAKSLLQDGHEVLVIEKDAARASVLSEDLETGVLHGDGCEVARILQAGMERADVVIAVTGDDEDNLVVCQIARHRFHVARTIARINNPKNEKIFRELGIDVTVSSTELILSQIEQVIPSHSLVHLLSLKGVGVSFVEMKLPDDSPAIGRPLRTLGIPDDSIFPLVIRQGKEAVIPFGDTVLMAGDEIIAVTSEGSQETLMHILCG